MKFDLGKQFFSGEFKIIHKDKEGNIKQELDWQPNMLLENGLKCLFNDANTMPYTSAGNTAPTNQTYNFIPAYLVIGTGNSDPAYNQIKLDNATHIASWNSDNGIGNAEVETPDVAEHSGYLKVSQTFKYSFNNFTENLNITEIGLSAYYSGNITTTGFYVLGTRALIKDRTGTPLPITVLTGEILEVYYKVNTYIDTRRKTGSFTLTDIDSQGTQTTHTFDYFIQPVNLKRNKIYGRLTRPPFNNSMTSFGVLETDDELDANYNLNDEIYNQITYETYSALNQKTFNNGATKITYFRIEPISTLDTQHARWTSYSTDWNTKTYTLRITNGINTHNWGNGIRAFILPVDVVYPAVSMFNCYTQLVVVKNRANGQGIKKINTKEWTVEWSYSIDKWD